MSLDFSLRHVSSIRSQNNILLTRTPSLKIKASTEMYIHHNLPQNAHIQVEWSLNYTLKSSFDFSFWVFSHLENITRDIELNIEHEISPFNLLGPLMINIFQYSGECLFPYSLKELILDSFCFICELQTINAISLRQDACIYSGKFLKYPL